MVSARKTVRDMARLRRNKIYAMIRGSRMTKAILLLFLYAGLSMFYPRLLHAQDKDIVLPESGIHYPGGFDANTVGIVHGRVYEFSQPASGPVQFRLKSDRENYTIIASPLWYWKDLGVKIPDGTEVKVRGSKSLGKNGKLYVIGQEMEVISAGKVYAFRDDNGYPLWKGGRSGARGIGGGFGSTQHRFGGGMNSMGKGRR